MGSQITSACASPGVGQTTAPVFTAASSTIAVSSLTDTLPTFPMRPARPRSTTAAPPHACASADDAPIQSAPPDETAARNATRMVPTFIALRSTGLAPGFAPAASSRLRRGLSRWPPRRDAIRPAWEFPGLTRPRPTSTHRHAADIHRIGAGDTSRGFTCSTGSSRTPSVSLTRPGPSGSPGPSRLCRGCSHLPRHLPSQAAASFARPPRRPDDEGLAPPSEEHNALWRTARRIVDQARGLPSIRQVSATRMVPECHGHFSAVKTLIWPGRTRFTGRRSCDNPCRDP